MSDRERRRASSRQRRTSRASQHADAELIDEPTSFEGTASTAPTRTADEDADADFEGHRNARRQGSQAARSTTGLAVPGAPLEA